MIENLVLTPPDDVWADYPILPIYKNRKWQGHISARSLIPANEGAIYYVDPVLGSDYNSGTAVSPKRTMIAALRTTNVGMVMLAPGHNASLNDGAWSAPVVATIAPHVIIRPWNIRMGRPLVTNAWAHQESNWTVEPGYPRVYSAIRGSVTHVVDFAGGLLGRPAQFARVASVAQVSAQPGSICINGTKISVNTINGAVPSSSLKVFIGNYCAAWPSNKGLYVEGIDFVGGLHTFWILDQSCDAILSDCGIYCGAANGLFANTSGTVITERCRSDYHGLDAFNYHASATRGPGKAVEVGNRVTLTGVGVGASNQCSTAHDQFGILRIGCDYDGAGTHIMADVNAGTRPWNVGVRCGASRDPAGYGYYTVDAVSHNYDCDFGTSLYPLGVAGGEAFLDSSEPSAFITSGGGTISQYAQS